MRVFEAIAEDLARQRVGPAFTLMSQETTKLTAELVTRGVRVYHTRHEHTAVGMADGFARATNDIGVAIVGVGPGLTNAMNALITASKARSGVLVLAGDTAAVSGAGADEAREARLTNKHIDQPALLDALGVGHIDVRDPSGAVSALRKGIARVRHGRGPQVVHLPMQLLEREVGSFPPVAPTDPAARPPMAASDTSLICELLGTDWAARRPVILAGRGAVRSGARADIVRLGEITGALLGTTLMAEGLFSGEPWSVGVVGTFATPVASELLQSAEVVLSFGASLNPHTTYSRSIFGKARIVQIDDDRAALQRHQDADIAVLADAREAAAALVAELRARGHSQDGYRTSDVAARLASVPVPRGGPPPDGALDQRRLMHALNDVLPRPRTVLADVGNHMGYPIYYFTVDRERSDDSAGFIWPIDYFAVGCALGPALGAAAARSGRRVVLCIGDGGLMMTLSDLQTAARYHLPVIIVVSNDSALGAELHYLRQHGYDDAITRHANPSFEALARDLGIEAVTIRSLADLETIRPRLVQVDGPLLLDCIVSPEVDFHTGLH